MLYKYVDCRHRAIQPLRHNFSGVTDYTKQLTTVI